VYLGEVGFDSQCLGVVCGGLVEPALTGQCVSEVVVCIGEVGPDS